MKQFIECDLLGNEIEVGGLRGKYQEPPFTVLDTRGGSWQSRREEWKSLGIRSEIGRDSYLTFHPEGNKQGWKDKFNIGNVSIFDPTLCELMYKWFCDEGGKVLDPFAGGSVRGIVANYLGYKYTGIDIRQEQVDSNVEQARKILPGNEPLWIVGDSDKVLDNVDEKFDMVFSCPPYANLEKYSDLPGDISNMDYPEFMKAYRSIVKKSCDKLKEGCMAVFVVGEVRGKDGNYLGFVPDTVQAFKDAGMHYYNEAVLLNSCGTAMFRVGNCMPTRKLVKTHQNVLVFKK